MADDWITSQRKAFLRWANSHLKVTGQQIESIETGFKDGILLCKLIGILTGEEVPFPNPPKKCKMEIHYLENINAALRYLTDKKGIRLVGIGARDVYEGSEKLILGLMWTIILRLEISEFSIDGIAGKKGLLLWCQRVTEGYPKCGSEIKNFAGSWRNGLGFCAIIHHFRPDCLNFEALDQKDSRACCEAAIAAATDLGIPALLEASDLDTPKPDEKVRGSAAWWAIGSQS
jgi:actinin alpha